MPVYATSCLPLAMSGVRSAIELDNGEKVQEAYTSYLSSIIFIIKNLKDDAYNNDFQSVCDEDTIKLVKIAQHCLGRTYDLLSSYKRNDTKKIQPKAGSLSQDVTDNATSNNSLVGPNKGPESDRNASGHSTPTRKRSLDLKIQKLIDSMPAPPFPKNSGLSRRVSSVEKIQNRQMFKAYQRRRISTQPKYQSDYNLGMFRKTCEDMAIEKAKHKILEQKLTKRREYFRQKAEERFSNATGSRDTDAAYEKKIFAKVLEFEQETTWPQKLREQLEGDPENTALIESVVITVLSTKEHPLGQQMAEMQYALYRALSLIVAEFNYPGYPVSHKSNSDCVDGDTVAAKDSSAEYRKVGCDTPENRTKSEERKEEDTKLNVHKETGSIVPHDDSRRRSLDTTPSYNEDATGENTSTAEGRVSFDSDGNYSQPTHVSGNLSNVTVDSIRTSSEAFESAFQDLEDFLLDSIESDDFELLPDKSGLVSEAKVCKTRSDVSPTVGTLNEEEEEKKENMFDTVVEHSENPEGDEILVKDDDENAEIAREIQKDVTENAEVEGGTIADESVKSRKEQCEETVEEDCHEDALSPVVSEDENGCFKLESKESLGAFTYGDENEISILKRDIKSNKDITLENDKIEEDEIKYSVECNETSDDESASDREIEPSLSLLSERTDQEKSVDESHEEVVRGENGDGTNSDYLNDGEHLSTMENMTDLGIKETEDTNGDRSEGKNAARQLSANVPSKDDTGNRASDSADGNEYNKEGAMKKGESECNVPDDENVGGEEPFPEAEDASKETEGMGMMPIGDMTDGSESSSPAARNITDRDITDSSDLDVIKSRVEKVVKEIHSSIGKLHSLLIVTYKELDLPIGRDQSYATLESVFFKPLWQWVNLAFRRLNMQKELILFDVMQKREKCDPAQFFIREKFALLDSEVSSTSFPYKVAVDELRKIVSLSSPLDKLECLVLTTKMVCRSVFDYWTERGELSPPVVGCDDLLPIFTYVVVKTALPQLVSECHAMEEFIHESYLLGEEGYCLTTLSTAISYCLNLQHGGMYAGSPKT